MKHLTIQSDSTEQTVAVGESLGQRLRGGDLLALIGSLGAGKTYLTKGIAAGLGVAEPSLVTSPTFTLLNEYIGRMSLYHFDAFRLNSADDIIDLGADEIFCGNGVCVIEWADRVRGALPAERLDATLTYTDGGREITFDAHGEKYESLLDDLKTGLPNTDSTFRSLCRRYPQPATHNGDDTCRQ